MTRIVSLIASATEIVNELGELPHLVGCSHECDFPPDVRTLPVCTRPAIPVDGNSREIDALVRSRVRNALSVYDVFDDVLERLQPTHIITQTQCEVCAVSLRDVELSVASRLASSPRIISLQPDSLAAIWEDIRRVAQALGIDERGERVIGRLQQRMGDISALARASAERPRLACVEWIEPLMAAGNWMPELVEMAGGVDAPANADSDVIVVMPCGFDMERTHAEMHWLTGRPDWPQWRAVKTGRVYLADGNQFFNRPGPRIVESLRILAEILHPGRFEPQFEGTGWVRFGTRAESGGVSASS